MKKRIVFVITFFVMGVSFFTHILAEETKSCVFCDENILNYQKFYENELCIALYTHKPIVKAHFLIIPKRHVERFEDLYAEEFIEIQKVIKKVHLAAQKTMNISSYFLLQKNGREVGQTVNHVHFHYVGKEKGDSSQIGMLFRMVAEPLRRPVHVTTMQAITKAMQEKMD